MTHPHLAGQQLKPSLLILNQMAGPLTWELAEDLETALGPVALLTGHPDTLAKTHAAVRLYRAPAYQREGYLHRVLSWLAYMIRAFIWLLGQPKETPLLLFSNPPMLCWLGYLMHRLRGQTYSVMVHDIYPDVLLRAGLLSEAHPLIKLWRGLNRRAYEHAKVVMTLGECMAENLAQQFDPTQTAAGKVEVIYPWVDTEQIKPIPKADNWFAQKYNQVDKLTVMYSGNMGLAHDIETMLAAAEQLQGAPKIHFMFIGAGPKWALVEETIREKRLTNITLLPWQLEEDLPYSLATADIGLVSLDELARGMAFPSKTFMLMAAGAAIVGLSCEPSDLQLTIERSGCGVNLESQDVAGLVTKIGQLRKDGTLLGQYRRAAWRATEHEFSRTYGMGVFRSLLKMQNQISQIPEKSTGLQG
ncbi:MAG TPA: glycosyltransferase family 4 protein [Anaerolineae bacterium]|nr:glycosyltransferase family 4 protein [Anaerolineae bacterium]